MKLLPTLIMMAVLGLIYAESTEKTFNQPNIVIIMADDLGIDDVSFHGKKQHITPNMDALAYHGMILQHHYTPPICTPSRSAFMTGKYPIHTATQHFVISNEQPWGLPVNITTIAEVFKDGGYSTNLVGKWHLGLAEKEYFPTERGFDYHYGYLGGYIDYYNRMALMPIPGTNIGYDFRRNLNIECGAQNTYVTDLLTTEAENVIKAHDTEKPLFLLVNHLAPHTGNEDEPLQAPKEEIEKFNYIEDENRRIYAAMISKLDDSIGNITKALDDKGILDNTILIFYADNGAPSLGFFANTGSNYPFRGQKNTPWEGGVRVAGAIWSPLLQNPKSVFDQHMYVADWLPTLATAAGIEIDPLLELDGIDLWDNLVSGKKEPSGREIVHMLDDIDNVVSIMSNGFKYVKGTTIAGKYDTVLMGRQKEQDPRDINYATTILNSTTSKVLAKYDKTPLTENEINNLRTLGEIKCANPKVKNSCNPLIEECLYNINEDPCEENNLARDDSFKSVLQDMRDITEEQRATARKPANMKGLSWADPSVHDCTWTNFLQVPQKRKISNCSYRRKPCPAVLDS
ncbi:arylsulfatase B [Episyrphus balteatus]|uniref:arylsulfatase B n=1 Tax=Episyrphus balteatus TaxID=286459 RepID=UPI00248614A4|nr:arylsulfatase B [Episyrphus balteatus]XP_055856438.1 arylsulfatase B [Episyrphus balteatus]